MGEISLSGDTDAALSARKLFVWKTKTLEIIQHNIVLLALLTIIVAIAFVHLWESQPKFYAHAYENQEDPDKIEALFSASAAEIISGRKPIDSKLVMENSARQNENSLFEQQLNDLVKDSPIREMVPYIAQREKRVAALLVGIARKESSWGAAAPSKNGKTCYNYWGLKGSGSLGQGMGYACFASPEEAVKTVGDRIEELAIAKKLDTPAKMIVWKCGSSCAGHDPKGVSKWISDVDQYFKKIVEL